VYRKFGIAFFLFITVLPLFAQKQANIWYFGNGAGLDFNYSPPRALRNGQANSQEGCATISDNNGRLLFYTNGLVVMNRKHEIMLNGNGLRGDLSSTSNTIIVQMPDNDSLYYLFTVGATTQLNKGLRYNVINIKGDGGFGEVIEKNTFIDEAYEKLAAVRHCNKKDIWIVIRRWESDEYDAYLLTPSGFVSTPVVSHTGFVVGGIANNAIGTLKFSADGKKLAAVHSTENDAVELMQFDNATGIISAPVVFKPNITPHTGSFTGVYAAEFSPDGKLLYVSANNSATDPCTLFQFDITSQNAASIMISRQIIAQSTPWFAGGLQTGPDGKIYLAMWRDTAISVIDNPNVYGTGCNFVYNKILLSPTGEPLQFGLPAFIQSDLSGSLVPYNFSRTPAPCTNNNVQFVINRINEIDSVKWNFGDGNISQSLSPAHLYSTAGMFTVTLIVYTTGCQGVVMSTITKQIWIADASVVLLGADILSCSFQNLSLTVNVQNVNYLWSNGSSSNTINIPAPGSYWVQVEQQGCTLSDTINISTKPKPFVELGNDTTVCSGTGIILSGGNATATAYLWSTGETSPVIKIYKPGKYNLQVTENNCSASDSVNVVWGDCPFYIPNAFTPNGDGKNDSFGLLNGVTLQDFSMKIYDRYGHIIFASNNVNERWNGTYKDKTMPAGSYTWQVTYINGLGYTKWLKGFVLLIH
jgi:gliding motility-associated-like protein